MTHSPFDADVAIIGYGPSGVVAANALGQYGISAIALEREVDIYPRARAVTVHEWTMRCLQSLGLDEEVKKDTDVSRALRWITYDGQELMRMNSLPGNLGHEQAYAIYQPLLEETLRKGVERYEQVSVRYGNEVTAVDQDAEGVTVTMRSLGSGETSTIRTKYALACDGGSSFTRKYLDVPLEGETLPVRWIIIDAKVKRWWPNRHILTFWSDTERPVVDIALSRGNHRWEMPLKADETDADFDSADKVWPLLEAFGVTHEDVDLHQWAFYNHNVRFAKDWRVGRVFLVGDAAHLMPPWAGAGMQSGMRDSFNLAWKLREVIQGRLPSGLLDSYQPEREPNVRFYTDLSVQMGRLVKQEMSPEEMAAMAPKPGELPPMLLPPFYVDGWFSATPTPESAVGKMIPQPRVGDPRGVIDLLDAHLGNGFVLLGDGIDPAEVLTVEQKAGWDSLLARYIAVRQPDQGTAGPDELIDIEGTLLEWMRGHGVRVIAVRPDKFVAASDSAGLDVPTSTVAGEPAPATK